MANNTLSGKTLLSSLFALLALVILSTVSAELHAESRAIDSISTDPVSDGTEIRIDFTLPMQYVTHAPASEGDELHVQLRPVAANASIEEDVLGQDTLDWKPSPSVPLAFIRYESESIDRVDLRLQFQRLVHYRVRMSSDSRSLIITVLLPPAAPAADLRLSIPTRDIPLPASPPLEEGRAQQLMEEGRQAMTAQDNSRAIQIFTKLLQHQGHPYLQDAQELLGLARERKGQLAHAKIEYEKYLSYYPKGEGAERVQQRLAGLITAREAPKEKLRAARDTEDASPWDVYGSFSQFYRRDVSITDATGSTVNQSSLASDVDITARQRSQGKDLRARFTGGYLHDFLSNGSGSETRVSSFYFDYSDKTSAWSGRLGRQSRSTGGVLGRFDGVLASYRLNPTVKINGVFGYPVDSSNDNVNNERRFYGISADLGNYADAWDFVAFFIQQDIGDLTDRQAVGGEVRYFQPGRSLLGLVDYDILYDDLNTLLLFGNLTLPNKLSINTTLDYRKSPILTTRNALQGQSVSSIDELQLTFNEDQIRSLAEDRTATSSSFTLGLSMPIHPKLQISGDITATELSDTPASGGVAATPGTDTEFFYNLQLIGSNLIKEGDIAILGLRHTDATTSNTTSVIINTRYPVTRDWRVNPRLRIDYRQDEGSNPGDQWTLAPSLRMDYRWRKNARLELELGGEWTSRELTGQTENSSAYFLSLGYRMDF